MYLSVSHRAALAYRRVDLESIVHGADAHRLIDLLLDRALECMRDAAAKMRQGDGADWQAAIGRATRIVEEGLRSSLNPQAQADICASLSQLYDCIAARLAQANVRAAPDLVDEAVALLEPVSQAWKAVRDQHNPVMQ